MELFFFGLSVLVVIFLVSGVRIVPQQRAYIIERLGKFQRIVQAGMTYVIPFVDSVAYKLSLKEMAIDIPEQVCITKDNVQVGVDGVVFAQVIDPRMAAYGIADYKFAIVQLAQTTMRSEVGKIDLDKTFEERNHQRGDCHAWMKCQKLGVESSDMKSRISPPRTVLGGMEKQMRAEQEKRASILQSEGEKQSAINVAEGQKQKVVLESEASRQRQINEAVGQAEAIKAVASATAEGIRAVAQSIQAQGGLEAVQLRVAERLVDQFGGLAKNANTMIASEPRDLSSSPQQ
jgi:regulator of protease activity HflC (stomatin/prohibitin superfamily)